MEVLLISRRCHSGYSIVGKVIGTCPPGGNVGRGSSKIRDNFVIWKRAITAYLREKDALRVVKGRKLELYRNPHAPLPTNHFAGDVEPGPVPLGAPAGTMPTSTTGLALTVHQGNRWKEWERKESKARSAILRTVSHGIASDIENLWSSTLMYAQILDKHRTNLIERRADLNHRMQLMRLPAGANREQMLKHYEDFSTLMAEASAAQLIIEPLDKCERFIFTLPQDLETLRIQWRVMPAISRNWRELVALYKIIADERGLTAKRDTMIAAIFKQPGAKAKGKGEEKGAGRKNGRGGKGNGEGNGSGGGGKGGDGGKKKGKGGKGDDKPKCTYCNFRNHTEKDCRAKANGDPSFEEIKRAVAKMRNEKNEPASAKVAEASDASRIFGSISSIEHVVEPTIKEGSANATILSVSHHNDNEYLIDSGASHHIAPNDDGLVKVVTLDKPLRFNLAGSEMEILAHKKGMLAVTLSNGLSFGIEDIYVVPQARMRIFSYGLLAEAGWTLNYMGRKLHNSSRIL